MNFKDEIKNKYINSTTSESITYYFKFMKFYTKLASLLTTIYVYGIEENTNKLIVFLRQSGPLFVKIGQNMMDKNGLPLSITNKLKTLGDQNFRKDIVNISGLTINKTPLAAGSIAQIWIGTYEDNIVILKKLHKNIKNETINSIEMFENLKTNFNQFKVFNYIDTLVDFDEIYDDLLYQIDLRNEVENLNHLKIIFEKFKNKIMFPHVLNYTENYIIESYEYGIKFDEFIKKYPEHAEESVFLIYVCYYVMIFSNFVHCDFHQSNFLLRVKKCNNIECVQLVVLDYGLVTKIKKISDYIDFIKLFKSNLFWPELDGLIHLLIKINVNENVDKISFVSQCNDYLLSIDYFNNINKVLNAQEENDSYIDVNEIINTILKIAFNCKLKCAGSIINILNGFILINEYNSKVFNKKSSYNYMLSYAKNNGYYSYCLNQFKQTYEKLNNNSSNSTSVKSLNKQIINSDSDNSNTDNSDTDNVVQSLINNNNTQQISNDYTETESDTEDNDVIKLNNNI
jgi:predicted unusual protein kinase regulating ubiquinone biosynthesis (AarF/ABC1/UbiB family)